MKNAKDVIFSNLNYICQNLEFEFLEMAGKHLLIVGGAGFLGYYLIQSVLYWNSQANHKIKITVFDSYMRGIPSWLTVLEKDTNLTLCRHDITAPLPDDIGNFDYIIHAASIASPMYYRRY